MAESTRTSEARDQARDLINACLRGDSAAWSAFVDRYARLVYSVPRRYHLRAELCDDVFQSVFEIVLRQLHTISDPAGLPKWLITIAARESLRMVRRDRLSGPTEIAPYAAPPPEGEIAAMEERQIVRESLVELGEPCRSLLEALFGIDSPDYSSISARLSIPIGSIGPTRSRCLAKLRGVLRPRLGASR